MDGKFVLAVIAALVVQFVLGFFFHGVVLAPDYTALSAVYRGPDVGASLFVLMLLAMLIMSTAMVAIYRFGRQERPWFGQGARYGVMIACVSVIPLYLIGYVVTNITGTLAIKQIVVETITVVIMGLVIAWVHRR